MRPLTLTQFTNRYHVLQKIGSGSFGEVFRIEDIRTKRQCALKKIRLRKNESLEQFLREIQIQIFLAHPLVLKIFEFYVFEAQNPYLGKKQQIGIVMELGKRSLMELIKDKNQHFPLEEIINFAYHFIKLFAYFQDQNIVHRDIKPQNFIQFGSGLQCKIIDFGLCSHVNDIRTIAGSFHYFSPKLKKLHYNPKLNLKTNPYKDDVYSFGLTLYELITRKIGQATSQWGNSRYSRDVFQYTRNSDLTDIIQFMLEDDEDKRPDFIELYEIFNKKFTFYQEGQCQQSRQSQQFQIQKISTQQYVQNNSSNQQCLSKNDKQKMNQNLMNNEEFRRTSKQQFVFENGEYEFRTIKDFEKENSIDSESNIIAENSQQQEQSQFEASIDENTNEYENESCQTERKDQERQKQNQRLQVQNVNQNQVQPQPTIPQYQIQIPLHINQKKPQDLNYQRKNYHLGPKINITSIIIIKEFIISGCQDGSIYILNTQSKDKKGAYKIQGMKLKHTNAITAMGRDSHGRLWTCSADSKVLVWDRLKFFRRLLIQSYYHEETIQCTNNRGQKYTRIHNYIEMDPEVNFPVEFPHEHPTGISSLYCVDELNFVIGFKDGFVFSVWENYQVHYEAHFDDVTAIQIFKNCIFTSSLDGSIVVLELEEQNFGQNHVISQVPIRNFIVTGDLQNPHFKIVTADGRGYQIDGWKLDVDQQKASNLMYIPASIFVNEYVFYIDRKGNFYRNGMILQKCQGDGWNCMHWNKQDMMVMANNKGDIVLIHSK